MYSLLSTSFRPVYQGQFFNLLCINTGNGITAVNLILSCREIETVFDALVLVLWVLLEQTFL